MMMKSEEATDAIDRCLEIGTRMDRGLPGEDHVHEATSDGERMIDTLVNGETGATHLTNGVEKIREKGATIGAVEAVGSSLKTNRIPACAARSTYPMHWSSVD